MFLDATFKDVFNSDLFYLLGIVIHLFTELFEVLLLIPEHACLQCFQLRRYQHCFPADCDLGSHPPHSGIWIHVALHKS